MPQRITTALTQCHQRIARQVYYLVRRNTTKKDVSDEIEALRLTERMLKTVKDRLREKRL